MAKPNTNDHLADMAILVRVVDCGSFSAAARSLGLTPSAVSRMVSRLEKTLSLRLLVRNTRHLRLTEHGAAVLAHGRAMLSSADAVLALAQHANTTPSGRVRIGAPKAFARRVLHPVLTEFLRQQPAVSVQLVVQDALLDPVRDGVDLMIQVCEQPPQAMVARRLHPVRQLLCASTHYLATHPAPRHPSALQHHDCLSLGESVHDDTWRLRHPDGTDIQVTIHGRYSCNHSEARLEAMLAGMGIACLPDFIARDALRDGQAGTVLDDWQFAGPYQGHAWLLYPPGRSLPLQTRVLADYLQAVLGS